MITETVNERITSRVRYVKPGRFSSATGTRAELPRDAQDHGWPEEFQR